jgi:membrane protease YdiL (CAAX protease family)
VLHVLPGSLTTAAFLMLKPLLDPVGYPPLLAFLLAVLLVDLPVLLGTMFYEGKRRNGTYSLKGVVLYRDRVPWRRFALLFMVTFVATYALMMAANPLVELVRERVFSWLPEWMFLEEQAQYQAYPRSVLLVTLALQLALTGVALPWVEELYFRGYLLPRMSRYRAWTPLLGGLLFGLYHVWQPFGFATVFLLGAVLGYVVCWTRDIRISIALHVFANGVVRLMFLMTALAM